MGMIERAVKLSVALCLVVNKVTIQTGVLFGTLFRNFETGELTVQDDMDTRDIACHIYFLDSGGHPAVPGRHFLVSQFFSL